MVRGWDLCRSFKMDFEFLQIISSPQLMPWIHVAVECQDLKWQEVQEGSKKIVPGNKK